MGLLDPKKPVESQELRDCAVMLAEARTFSKNLKKFGAAASKYEKTADKMVAASQGALDCNGTTLDAMTQARGAFVSDMAAAVHGPCSEWQAQFSAAAAQYKQLTKLASQYGKAEGGLDKVTAKHTRAQQSGAAAEKQAKLQSSVETKAQKHEAAKTAFVCTAPQVAAEFKSLLRRRDELRISLYSTFAVSGKTMQHLASLNPGCHGAPAGGSMPSTPGYGEKQQGGDAMAPYTPSPYKVV